MPLINAMLFHGNQKRKALRAMGMTRALLQNTPITPFLCIYTPNHIEPTINDQHISSAYAFEP